MLKFENDAAVMAYAKIRLLGVEINIHDDNITLTQAALEDSLKQIEHTNLKGKRIKNVITIVGE